MAITAEEFETNKAIATPPKSIPFIDEEDILFLQIWLSLAVALFVLLGMFTNIVKSQFDFIIPPSFFQAFRLIIFIFLPFGIITLMKLYKSGKPKGYLEQKMYFYFKSKLLDEIDTRKEDDRKFLKEVNKTVFNVTKSDDFWKNPPIINGKKIERYIDFKKNNNDFKISYNQSKKNLEKSINRNLKWKEMENKKLNEQLKKYYKFMGE